MRFMRCLSIYWVSAILLTGCAVNQSSFSPGKKYSAQQLQQDYLIYQQLLEKHHPSLYWYTGKDSMDYFFTLGRNNLKDSMTEPEFRKVLTYITSKINCGHTSVRSSKSFSRYNDTIRLGKMFPLSIKVWDSAMVVSVNLNRRDSVLKRGTVITSINNKPTAAIVDTLFDYISTDGYNRTHKYQALSNRGYFGNLYTSLFGLSSKYTIGYIDSVGQEKKIDIPVYNAAADTLLRIGTRTFRSTQQPSKKERKQLQLNNSRILKIDTVNRTAMMELATFTRGVGLKGFFRNSFKALKKNNIQHLIIDVRSNGGGSVNNSTSLTRYIAKQRFKIADSLFAPIKKSSYQKYIENHFWNKLFISFFTRKQSDGFYHFGYFERHYFKPKKSNHFDGKVYILTGGNSFSATTLFTSALIKQENVIVVGEETGGGAYGNSAWLIPDATLPVTGVRFRLPLFRLVIDKTIPKNGKGVQPEVPSIPTPEAIKRNADFKVEKVMELIKKDKTPAGLSQ